MNWRDRLTVLAVFVSVIVVAVTGYQVAVWRINRIVRAAQAPPAPQVASEATPTGPEHDSLIQQALAMGYEKGCLRYGGIDSVCAADAEYYARRVVGTGDGAIEH